MRNQCDFSKYRAGKAIKTIFVAFPFTQTFIDGLRCVYMELIQTWIILIVLHVSTLHVFILAYKQLYQCTMVDALDNRMFHMADSL